MYQVSSNHPNAQPSQDSFDKLALEAYEAFMSKVEREARSAWNRLIVREKQKHQES